MPMDEIINHSCPKPKAVTFTKDVATAADSGAGGGRAQYGDTNKSSNSRNANGAVSSNRKASFDQLMTPQPDAMQYGGTHKRYKVPFNTLCCKFVLCHTVYCHNESTHAIFTH
jgi:hypothetical protein